MTEIDDTPQDGFDPQPDPVGGTSIERRIKVLEHRARGQRRLVRGAFIGALGSLGAVLVWALSAREATGAERAQMRALEDAVRELRAVVFRVPWPRPRHDDDDPAPRPAAPLIQQAPKGTP